MGTEAELRDAGGPRSWKGQQVEGAKPLPTTLLLTLARLWRLASGAQTTALNSGPE